MFFLIVFLHAKNDLNSDEGVILEGAWNLLNGKRLYFDFFELTSPGAYYLICWFWKIFGVSYVVAKAVSILILYLCSIGIYKIWLVVKNSHKKFNHDWSIHFFLLIFVFSTTYWPIITYHIFSLLFIIWSTYFFIKYLENSQNINIILSGILTGISFLFLQPKGIVLALTFASFLFFLFMIEKKNIWLKALGIYSFFFILPILMLLFKWPFYLLFKDLIIFPLFNYKEVAMVPFYLLALFLFLLSCSVLMLIKERAKEIWLLFYLQLALLLSTYALADHFHIILIIFPLYIIWSFSIVLLKNLKYKKCIILVLNLAIFTILYPSILYLFKPGLFTSVRNLMFIDYLQKNCQDSKYIYAGPFMPGIYFESDKINPTPFSWLITKHHTPEQFAEAAETLKQKRPSCAILNYEMVKKYNYNQDNSVDNFIKQNYHQTYSEGNIIILRINN